MRRAEAQLRRSEDNYRQLFEISPDPTVVHDGQSFLMVNRAAAKLFALDDTGDAGADIWALLASDQRAELSDRAEKMLQSGQPTTPILVTLRALDGQTKEAEVTSAPTWWGGRQAMVTVFHDLTERRRAESALHDLEQAYGAVVEHAPIGMHFYALDPDGELVLAGANKAAGDILGIDHRALVGMLVTEAWPGLLDSDLPDRYRRIALEGGVDEDESIVYDDGVVSGAFEMHAFSVGQRTCVVMFRDVGDRIRNEAELDQYRHHLEELVADRSRALDQAHRDIEAVMAVAVRAVELRDPYTAGHQRRVAELSYGIAIELGLSEEVAEHIRVAGKLHDIGKLTIPAEILSKPGKLTPLEYELVKGHSEAAYEMLSQVDIGWPLAEMVRQHHERMDGSGYPRGLLGEEMLVEARILAVADVVEAMSSHRPYRPSLGMPEAIAEIERFAGACYDEDVVAACVRIVGAGFEFADVE
jgi:PAS domain S-box-containing protein